jgi:DNA-directed RNA polymerase specialized sigma24 family protein
MQYYWVLDPFDSLHAPVEADASFLAGVEVARVNPATCGIAVCHVHLSTGSVAAISKATIAANLPITRTINMKSDAIRQMFCERYLAGVLYRDICQQLGISLRTAANWAQEMELPRRKGGPRRHRWMPGKKARIV